MITVHGFAEEAFAPVARAFAENFDHGIEQGAACTVYHQGRLVVDLHAGDARPGEPWRADTMAVTYSVTKGLMALCAYIAQQRGLLDFDAPVATLWPSYAAHGKEETRIRDLFTHRAGLVALDSDLTLDDLAAWTPVIDAIEAQKPLWRPGTQYAYHALTYGWLTGEVLRRATGLRPHDLIASYLTGPLDADAWIGLPAEQETRVAHHATRPDTPDPALDRFVEAALTLPAVLRSITLGGALPPTMIDGTDTDFNAPAVHALQIPAAGGIATARALAKIYAAAVTEIDGNPPLLTDASKTDATTVRSEGEGWPGAVTAPGIRFSTGFMINGIPYRPLLSDASFGHDGASGSLAFADAQYGIGFAYLNNRFGAFTDNRPNRLTHALKQSLNAL